MDRPAYAPAGVPAIAQTFYQASAQASFALLGLWWVVVNRRYDEWSPRAQLRRRAYAVSLYFALPGVISLISLVAENSADLWRIGFSLAAAVGLGVSAVTLAGARRASPAVRVSLAANVVLYALVLVFALFTGFPAELGLELGPREVEALLVSTLVFVGVNLAWLLFTESPDTASRDTGATRGSGRSS